MKRLLILAVACLLVGSSFAVEPQAGEQKKLISVDFRDTPLNTVLDIMSLKTGFKFITDGELARKRIFLSLKDVTATDALNALLDTYNLYYVRQGDTDIYVIKAKTDDRAATLTKVFFLNYSSATELEKALKANLSKNGSASSDSRTNSLIVTDSPENISKIDALLKELDIPTMQVLLEAKIVDVKIDSDLKIGTDIGNVYRTSKYWTDPLELYRGNYLNSYQVSQGQLVTVPYSLDKQSIQPEVSYGQSFAPNLATSGKLRVSVLSGDYNVNGFIEAMKQDSNAKLLTNPRLLVMNGQEANIDIIEEVPYPSQTVTGSGVNTISTQFKEVGIKLKVKPQINRDGSIVLMVSPEQSFRTGESIDNVPIINTSKSNTTFIIKNSETAVIGGLIRETEAQTDYKVPLLGDIPVLGYLFKRMDKQKVRTELTIFITAKVVQQ